MSEEEKIEQTKDDENFGAQDYIDNLNALKDTMVSKDDYLKVVEDNRKLMNALANGDYSEKPEPKEPVDLDKLRYEVFAPEKQRRTNLQYFKDVMALRDGLIEAGEPDPFLPHNREYVPNQQDIETVENMVAQIKECIEQSEGDSRLFNALLQRQCGVKRRG